MVGNNLPSGLRAFDCNSIQSSLLPDGANLVAVEVKTMGPYPWQTGRLDPRSGVESAGGWEVRGKTSNLT